ncbi:hypothetical protein H113_04720 [Trichophyton rubrum MR1459]|nr:hypothetical protein H113_04720 [Trichophyton rubrum MR1459]
MLVSARTRWQWLSAGPLVDRPWARGLRNRTVACGRSTQPEPARVAVNPARAARQRRPRQQIKSSSETQSAREKQGEAVPLAAGGARSSGGQPASLLSASVFQLPAGLAGFSPLPLPPTSAISSPASSHHITSHPRRQRQHISSYCRYLRLLTASIDCFYRLYRLYRLSARLLASRVAAHATSPSPPASPPPRPSIA